MLEWALLADLVPLYPVYALLFVDTGLSPAEISGLFAIWSAVGIVAEVPSGALADRFGRRNALVAAGVLQAAAYVVWVLEPGFVGFAVGFVVWGLGGALVSGAQEALLYDGLAAVGAQSEYARVNGWVTAAASVAEFPAAGAATLLFALGGYDLVGWVSVGVCLAGSALAMRLPEPPSPEKTDSGTDGDNNTDSDDGTDSDDDTNSDDTDSDDDLPYFATLRAGVAEAAARPGVRAALVAAALVGGFDALEEYFPLVTESLGVPTVLVPLAMLPIALAGAVGSAMGGYADRLRPFPLGLLLATGMVLLAAGGLAPSVAGIAAVAVAYGVYSAVAVAVDARLQHRIASRSRATVTSVAALGVEGATFAVYAAWALGGLTAIAGLGAVIAVALPFLLRRPRTTGRRGG